METIDAIVLGLNDLLKAVVDDEQIKSLFSKLKNQYSLKFILVDFEYYDENRFDAAQKKKIAGVKAKNFEVAALQRGIEKECLKYISLKAELNLTNSTFFCDNEYLVYCYLGTAENDKIVKEYFRKISLQTQNENGV